MDKLLGVIERINDITNKIVWGMPVLCTFLLVGMIYSIKSGFFQITGFKCWISATLGKMFKQNADKDSGGISAFQAMSTALAASIGTGNIIGVASGMMLGGAGTVFWMWVAAVIGMMTSYAENALGIRYRTKNKKGEWIGGPMYYIEKGLKQKWLAVFFAVACMLAALGVGNMVQSNSIAGSLNVSFGVPKVVTGIIIAVLTGITIFGGLSRIAKATEKLVPIMAIFYILGCFVVIFANFDKVGGAFTKIFEQAFTFKSALGGAGGYTIGKAMKYGISRGVFSNEAGLGSSPIVYAASENATEKEVGMWGIFQVFTDTVIVCTLTAICLLVSGALDMGLKDGVEVSTAAFEGVFGRFGSIFVSVSIVMFAFATLISWSYYGERCLEYLTDEKYIVIYKAFYVVFAMFGCVIDIDLVWSISDTFNGLMALPNLTALILLSGKWHSENIHRKDLKRYRNVRAIDSHNVQKQKTASV